MRQALGRNSILAGGRESAQTEVGGGKLVVPGAAGKVLLISGDSPRAVRGRSGISFLPRAPRNCLRAPQGPLRGQPNRALLQSCPGLRVHVRAQQSQPWEGGLTPFSIPKWMPATPGLLHREGFFITSWLPPLRPHFPSRPGEVWRGGPGAPEPPPGFQAPWPCKAFYFSSSGAGNN